MNHGACLATPSSRPATMARVGASAAKRNSRTGRAEGAHRFASWRSLLVRP